jgi:hypothetical protein
VIIVCFNKIKNNKTYLCMRGAKTPTTAPVNFFKSKSNSLAPQNSPISMEVPSCQHDYSPSVGADHQTFALLSPVDYCEWKVRRGISWGPKVAECCKQTCRSVFSRSGMNFLHSSRWKTRSIHEQHSRLG